MSGRGSRKRGRPPKTPNDRVTGKFNYQLLKKPKYLSKTCESQPSTPSISRASSPQESDCSRSISRKLNIRGRPGRGRKSVNHTQSNTSFSGRRGYESEYHYGSDFGDSTDKSDVDDDLILSASEEDSFDRGNESESEFSVCSFNPSLVGRPPRPPSPDPVWLQGREYPYLYLPDSSEDLLIENVNVMDALGVYEVLRRFRHLVRLSPFRFEDFCAALVCDEQSALLSDVHIMLLKAILREEDVQGTHFGPLDQKDSVNISLYLIDCVTWPEVLRSYVESDNFFDRKVYNILSNGEYPYVSVEDRITILQFLTDQFLTTNAVRDVMLQEGPIHYDDHCRICHRLGKLLCCETCPAVYHLECVDPPLLDVPTEDWQCNLCKSHKVTGVVDCVLLQEKHGVLVRHDALGLDRHGRKFWFIARRIFVEDQNRENIWYYSTTSKFEVLLNLLDKEDLESGLYAQLNERKTEITRQIKITESITNEHKKNRKSFIEFENETTNSLFDSTNGVATSDKLSTENKIMTRQKKSQISNGTLYFKLGMENSFKNYINQYTTNPIALNKPQRNEERDKRRHLSHKFSLTTASEFKWFGLSMGTAENIISALRQTLLNFEQNIAAPFMNPNWAVIKKLWNTAVMNCRSAKDFSTVLLLFQSSVKNVIFANVWHEQLGHIALQRITSSEREERKKIEKREKRERDDEEERNRLAVNYIKYSLGLKHQVWKQKGEEYRVHGQWGWMWLSSSRRCGRFRKRHSVTQAISPFKTSVHYIYERSNEIITVDPRTQKFIQQCELSSQKGFNYNCLKNFKDIKIQNLEAIKNDIGVINVSMALNMPGRLLYPKVAKVCRIDNLLERRIKLKEFEEQQILKSEEGGKAVSQSQVSSTETKSPHKTFLEKRLISLLESQKVQSTATVAANVNLDLVKSLAKKIQTVRFQFSQLNRFAKQYRCYTKECNTNSNAVSQITQNTCYSPLCLQKARAKKELLLLLRKAHAAGNGSKETVAAILGAVKKPSILEQKLTEGKKDVISTYDDTDEYKSVEETPIDLNSDWEQARAVALEYDDKLLTDCYEPFIPGNSRTTVKNEPLDIGYVGADSKMDFIDNIEVCSNVEVESSETTDDSLAISNDDFDPLHLKKNRKSHKIKHKQYIGSKEVLDQTMDREIAPTRQNRRFPIHSRGIKREDISKIEKEFFPNGKEKLYSAMSTRGRIYLLREMIDINESDNKDNLNNSNNKTENISKYPLISNFLTHKLTASILVPPRFELMQLARNGGKISANGFHHLAKSNQIWPYPCSRPLFKTCWAYRTCNASSLSCVALQLRILWSCMRWDDMISKPPTTDGKHQVTTESEIVTLELLKHRNSGRYGERTTYLRRKVVIPLEMPKTIREVTSIRSGLRKRKRAESPQPTEPQVSEEWVDEDKLELWEIRFIGEKQEKSRLVATTRSAVAVRQNESSINPTISTVGSNNNTSNNASSKPTNVVKSQEDNKDQSEQVRIQRVSQPNKTRTDPTKLTAAKNTVIGNRRVIVKNPDGTTRVIQQAITSTSTKNISNQNGLNSSLPQAGSNASSTSGQQQSSTTPSSQPHKVQIIRGPDGKVSVRGLNPGQQLIQMPDGKLHVLTTSATSSQANKLKLAVKPTLQSTNSPLIKQFNMKPVSKTTTGVQQVQKITTVPATQNKPAPKLVTQIANQQTSLSQNDQKPATTTPNNKQNTAQNVQQLMVPAGQKILVTQNAQGQKVIISSGNQAVASGQTQLSSTSQTVPNQPAYQQQQQQQNVVNQTANAPSPQTQSTQKVIQQIVNTSNVQQQVMVGGQRIILNPGQTIVTQRSLPSNTQYPVASSQTTQVVIQSNQGGSLQSQPQSKVVKQITVPQQQSTQETQVLNNVSPSTSNLNNSNVSNNQQIVVQNSTLAQQLAQGKLQVATINGQQVIIKPLGNNQAQIVAHIKTQSDGNAHIVTNSQLDNQNSPNKPTTAQSQIQNPTVRSTPQLTVAQHDNVNISQTQPSTQQQQMTIEESLLQGQPPGTVIKCVTAQVIQTDQGPRIVLQGLVGNDFSSQQLALVQQQVKQQLLKAQESSGKQGVLGPTKVYLAVQPANPTSNSQPPPLTPVMPSSHQQALYITKTSLDSNTTNKIFDASLDDQQVVQQTTDENKNENIHKTFEAAVLKDNVIKNGEKNFTLQTHQSLQRKELSINTGTNNAVVRHSFFKRTLKSNDDTGWLMQKHHQNKADLLSASNDKELEKTSLGRTSLLNVNNCEFKLIETLERHKDILKKRILKKRSLLERNLQNEIKEEVEVNSVTNNTTNIEILKISGVRNDDFSVTDKSQSKQDGNVFDNDNEKNAETKVQQPRNKKLSKKKEKLYCVCRTPYDDTKFYVGCDLCSNWFHGDCVNITEETSKKLSEYICDDCKSARDTQQLYCSCRQPYDDSQFYICCDKCQDWFHGRCVGIVQSEAEFIDEYICPDCQRNNEVDNANMKNLTNDEKAELKKLIKQIQSHKSAWPFMEPVNPNEAPDYYKIIKEPMDLQKIEEKLNTNKYAKLSEFIGDMTKIFDNCRYYNPKESSFYKCAETLELYFVQQIKNFRKVAVDGQI